jgi:hypothetical protein
MNFAQYDTAVSDSSGTSYRQNGSVLFLDSLNNHKRVNRAGLTHSDAFLR